MRTWITSAGMIWLAGCGADDETDPVAPGPQPTAEERGDCPRMLACATASESDRLEDLEEGYGEAGACWTIELAWPSCRDDCDEAIPELQADAPFEPTCFEGPTFCPGNTEFTLDLGETVEDGGCTLTIADTIAARWSCASLQEGTMDLQVGIGSGAMQALPCELTEQTTGSDVTATLTCETQVDAAVTVRLSATTFSAAGIEAGTLRYEDAGGCGVERTASAVW